MAKLADLIEELVTANRILAREGVVDSFGHISARDPDNPQHYLLSRSRAPDCIEADDIAGFCSIYPTAKDPMQCRPERATDGGCVAIPAQGATPWTAWLLLLFGYAALVCRATIRRRSARCRIARERIAMPEAGIATRFAKPSNRGHRARPSRGRSFQIQRQNGS